MTSGFSLYLWLGCYQLGYEVGRYISLERLIEENQERYYETLEASFQGWHEAQHDPWPLINFWLYILKLAYGEFERRVGQTASPKGAKTEMIESAVEFMTGAFTVSDLERACPGVSLDMVRRVLHNLKETGKVESLGRGPGALWEKRGNKEIMFVTYGCEALQLEIDVAGAPIVCMFQICSNPTFAIFSFLTNIHS
jgi:hypothetical protein